MKKCSKCQETKTPESFPKAQKRQDGLSSWCKKCHCEHAQKWRIDNLERAKENERRWRTENPERVRERTRIWHKNNAEKVKEGAHRYYVSNKEKVIEKVKEWGASNVEKKREYRRKWRISNPERSALSAREWRRLHPERRREYVRKYRIAHLEQVADRQKEWRINNPERARECAKKWVLRNPERIRIKNVTRRARQTGASGSYTVQEWQEKIKEYGGLCAYCGEKKPLTADHVIPLSRGGSNYINNIRPACTSCNSSKGSKLLKDWMGGKFDTAPDGRRNRPEPDSQINENDHEK